MNEGRVTFETIDRHKERLGQWWLKQKIKNRRRMRPLGYSDEEADKLFLEVWLRATRGLRGGLDPSARDEK